MIKTDYVARWSRMIALSKQFYYEGVMLRVKNPAKYATERIHGADIIKAIRRSR